jgi:small subunit ribosomal protein S20
MPITASAKKAMRQAKARTQRRKPYKSRMKAEMKKFVSTVKTDKEAAAKLLPTAYSVIDTACKKNIIHRNNAARKKARLASLLTREAAAAPAAAKKTKAKTTAKKSASKSKKGKK